MGGRAEAEFLEELIAGDAARSLGLVDGEVGSGGKR